MRDSFRQSMTWLHTWVSLLVCWILYFVFITGSLGYFDAEIDRWMQPTIPMPADSISIVNSIQLAQVHLQANAPEAYAWYINPPVDRNEPYLWVAFDALLNESGGEGTYSGVDLDPITGEPILFRDTGGGQTLYKMHYALHYIPDLIATLFIGLCTMLMLLGLITGIVIHNKIFREFFTFRPNKKVLSWIDAHNMFGVMSLPFHIMITYSGLIMFLFTYMPLIVAGAYNFESEDYQRFGDEYLSSGLEQTERSGVKAQVMDLTKLYYSAEKRLGENQVRRMQVYQPGDANAVAIFETLISHPVNRGKEVSFSAVTGEFISSYEVTDTPQLTFDATLELHEGLFAGTGLRWLYFISGILGAAMIATGAILWTVKRRKREYERPEGPSRGFVLVEGLNIGTIVGLPVAIVIYFWANRLLPLGMTDRAEWEVHCLFITWGILLIHGIWYSKNGATIRGWRNQLIMAVAVFGLLPIINIFTTDRSLWTSIVYHDWIFVGVDMLCISIALASVLVVRYLPDKMSFEVKLKSPPPRFIND